MAAPDTCRSVYQNAITELTAAGVLVVVSAGNDSGPVETPANCPGVLAVGGLRHVGTKVGYSSLGPEISVSAPAGNCPDVDTTFLCSYSLVTADNTGLTVPASSSYTDDANYNIGTSFSAPIVAAVAGLMHAVNDRPDAGRVHRAHQGQRPALPGAPGGPADLPEPQTGLTRPVQLHDQHLRRRHRRCARRRGGSPAADGADREADGFQRCRPERQPEWQQQRREPATGPSAAMPGRPSVAIPTFVGGHRAATAPL